MMTAGWQARKQVLQNCGASDFFGSFNEQSTIYGCTKISVIYYSSTGVQHCLSLDDCFRVNKAPFSHPQGGLSAAMLVRNEGPQ